MGKRGVSPFTLFLGGKMLEFIKSDISYTDIELEIMNSQPAYNLISDKKEIGTL
jgi:hypothetical protein